VEKGHAKGLIGLKAAGSNVSAGLAIFVTGYNKDQCVLAAVCKVTPVP